MADEHGDTLSADAVLSELRSSHARLSAAVGALGQAELKERSYCTDWTIAEVLSHLGSGAEIFQMFFEAGLAGTEPPGGDAFAPVWQAWAAKPPAERAADCLTANETFLRRLEAVEAGQRAAFSMSLFGMDVDFAVLARMRLSEHAVHTWDVAVALDPSARVAAGAVGLLLGMLPQFVARIGRPAAEAKEVAVVTSAPERRFLLSTGTVSLTDGGAPDSDVRLELPAEAFLRLVYGRLDDEHGGDEVRASGVSVEELRAVFPGI